MLPFHTVRPCYTKIPHCPSGQLTKAVTRPIWFHNYPGEWDEVLGDKYRPSKWNGSD